MCHLGLTPRHLSDVALKGGCVPVKLVRSLKAGDVEVRRGGENGEHYLKRMVGKKH